MIFAMNFKIKLFLTQFCIYIINFVRKVLTKTVNKIKKSVEIQNCFEKFEVLESIYGNKDFGICFKFTFNLKEVYLKDDDFIIFVLSFGNKTQFIKSLYTSINIEYQIYYDKFYSNID